MEKVLNPAKAKDIIFAEIRKYEYLINKDKEYTNKIQMLEDVINILKSDIQTLEDNLGGLEFLISAILSEQESKKCYKNLSNYFYAQKYSNDERYLLQCQKSYLITFKYLEDLLESLRLEKEINEASLIRKKDKVQSYKIIYKLINNSGFLNTNLIDNFKNLMLSYGYDNIQIVKTLEKFNINFAKHRDDKTPNYTVINMLDKEYVKYDIAAIENYLYEEKLNPQINSLYDSLRKYGFDETLPFLPKYNDENITLEEFDYLFKNIINKLIDDLRECVLDISNIDMYKELKLSIIEEYNKALGLYNILLRYYKEERSSLEKHINSVKSVEETVNNLIYFYPTQSQKSYIENDLKNIPEEFYYDVMKLLNNLKKNNLNSNNSKRFNGNKKLKKFLELRDDQLRIMCRKISDNNYSILGIFQKQDDNDVTKYLSLAGRYPNNVDYEQFLQKSEGTEERLFEYLRDNMRKSSR